MGLRVLLLMAVVVVAAVLLAPPCCLLTRAADPDPVQDYCVADLSSSAFLNGLPCRNPASATSSDFRASLFRTAASTANPLGIGIGFAAPVTFPALNTQGLTLLRIDYAPDGFVPPHVHPRASEVVLVTQGAVLVGFVDTAGMYFSSTLYAGDLFVFPRGLVHFQLNVGNATALSYSSLNSQNPGLSLVASALFGSTPGIPDIVLEKTFALTQPQVEAVKKAFH